MAKVSKTRKRTTTGPKLAPRKGDLKVIAECLDLGIPLTTLTSRGAERRWMSGQITDQIEGKWVRTTHLDDNLRSLWISGDTVANLAAQARAKLARKDEIRAAQKADSEAF